LPSKFTGSLSLMHSHPILTSLKTVGSLVLKILGFVVFMMLVGSHFIADRLIFPVPMVSYARDYHYFAIQNSRGDRITCRYLTNRGARSLVIYSHGNGEDLGHIEPILKGYRAAGFSVLAYDYPGYGLSSGKPNEKATYQTLEAVVAFAQRKLGYRIDQIILHGRSVGCGPSIELATRYEFRALIVESGFTSAFKAGLGIGWLPWDRFKNLTKIDQITEPTFFIHGARDRIVDFQQGQALFDASLAPKFHYWVDSAGHNNIIAELGSEYWAILQDFERYALQNGA
jgi:fermentation-respiration switch protein FrsA (DUF1100 family)